MEKAKIIPWLGTFLVAGMVISCEVVVKNYSGFMKPLNQILSLAQYLESGDLSKMMDLDQAGEQKALLTNMNETSKKSEVSSWKRGNAVTKW